eukprot:11172584-Lingulodinium_polyedra.AAC.1
MPRHVTSRHVAWRHRTRRAMLALRGQSIGGSAPGLRAQYTAQPHAAGPPPDARRNNVRAVVVCRCCAT